MNYLILLLVGSVFLGANILSIDLGFASLSLYRLLFIIVSGMTGYILISDTYVKYDIIKEIKENNYIKIYGIWLIYAFLSILWAVNFDGWIKGLFFVSVGTLTIFYMNVYLKNYDNINRLFNLVFIMMGMHQLFGWIEILTNTYFWADLDKLDRYGTFALDASTRTPITIFANRNDYATLLVAGIAISLIILYNAKSKGEKGIAILSILSSLYLIERTVSRANTLALIILFGSLFLIKGFTNITFKRIVKTIVLSSILFGIIYISIPFVRETVNVYTLEFITNSFPENSSNRTRINLILNGFVFLFSTLGLGVGAGNIEYWMGNYKVFSTGGVLGDITNMHNWFMEILTGYGVIIFTLYLGMYVYMLRKLYLNYKYSKKKVIKNTSYILLAYMIAFFFSSVSSANNIFIEWQWVFWGLIISFIRFSETDSIK